MSSSGNTLPVSVHMTSMNGTVHRVDKSLDNEGTDTHARPSRRRSRSRSRSRSTSTSTRDFRPTQPDNMPLLNDAAELIPPTSARNPELNDDDDDVDVPFSANGGVDDGFFPPTTTNAGHTPPPPPSLKPRIDGTDVYDRGVGNPAEKPNGGVPTSDPDGNGGRRESIPFPYAPGYPGTSIQVFSDGENNPPRIIPDVNVYQQKKNLAQGMMDLALISANANQLRYVLESFGRHPYYYFSVIFISFSLVLQVAVGIGLILNSRYNVKNQDDICKADKINNMTIIGIFLITIVNVFIASFGVADVSPPPRT